MALNAVGDILFHLSRIQNIDCFGFGFYKVRLQVQRVSTEEGERRVECARPHFIPQKPFSEKKDARCRDAQLDQETCEFVSQVFLMRGHNEEVELNDMVLFKFERPLREKEWLYQVVVSLWRCLITPNSQVAVDTDNYCRLYTKVIQFRSLEKNMVSFMPVYFQPHRTCILHMTGYIVTLGFRLEGNSRNLDFIREATENFSPQLLDKLHLLISRQLFHSVKLVCGSIRKLLSNYSLSRESLFEDLVVAQMGVDQLSATAHVSQIESQNRTLRDKLLHEAMAKLSTRVDQNRFFSSELLPDSRYVDAEVQRTSREYEGLDFLSADQRAFLAKSELTPLTALIPPGSSAAQITELLFKEANAKTSLLSVLWVALFDILHLLGKYAQPSDRSNHLKRFGGLTQLLTQTVELKSGALPWVEYLRFTSSDYLRVLEKAQLQERFLGLQDALDKDIKELLDTKQVPVLFREDFRFPYAEPKPQPQPYLPPDLTPPLAFASHPHAPPHSPPHSPLHSTSPSPAPAPAPPSASCPIPALKSPRSPRSPLSPPLEAISERKKGHKDLKILSELFPMAKVEPTPTKSRTDQDPDPEPEPQSLNKELIAFHSRRGNEEPPVAENFSYSRLHDTPPLEEITMVNPLNNSLVKVTVRTSIEEREESVDAGQAHLQQFIKTVTTFNETTFHLPETAPTTESDTIFRLCFLVHGLEGSSQDLRCMRSILRHLCPGYVFFISEANQHATHDPLEVMGLRLAAEVRNFIRTCFYGKKFTISFIGHSLGGLIIRAALGHLAEFKDHFRAYFSLCSPHLGVAGGKFLVSVGIKLMSSMEKYKSMRQMSLEDKEKVLVKIAEQNGLSDFETLGFFGFYKDGYVSVKSAKVLSGFDNGQKNAEKIAKSMLGNLKSTKRIIKLAMYMPGLEKGWDKLVGRMAHVEIVRNPLMQQLVWSQLKEFI